MRARDWTLPLSLLTLVASSALAAKPASTMSPADSAAMAEAKQHVDTGQSLYKEARYQEAITEYEQAITLSIKVKPEAAGVVNYNLGQAYEKMGDIAAAVKAYKEYLRLAPKATDRPAVQTIVGNLEARLAKGLQELSVSSDPTGANVSVDGKLRATTPVTMELGYGAHELELTHEGYESTKRTVELTPQSTMKLDVSLAKKAAPTPPPAPAPAPAPVEKPRIWTWVAVGGTALAVLGAAAAGSQARDKAKELKDSLHQPPEPDALYDASVKAQQTSNALWATAGIGAIASGVLFMVEGKF
ncbi:MAG TPA: PEGA domain-containing protein [Myxococcaceae bacterium]|jgi:tetratricopeptide (TPR) repeat protein